VKPQLSNPSVALRSGSKARHPGVLVSTAVTPTDVQIAAYDLEISNNGEQWSSRPPISADKDQTKAPGTRLVPTKLPISNEIRFRMRANTPYGRSSSWVASDAFNVCLYEETDKSVRLEGSFESAAVPGASGGTVKSTTTSAKVQFTFTGSSVGFVSSFGPDRGKVAFKIDGVKQGRLNLYGARIKPGRVVWATSVPPGRHVLTVLIKGTHSAKSSGSRVDVDGFVTSGFGKPNQSSA